MLCLISLRILIGILLGPDDLLVENDSIILEISSEVVGDKKKVFAFRFLKKIEKWRLVDGIDDLTSSATDEKKSLKELDTVSGSEDIEFPTEMDIGFEDLEDLREIRFRTPDQTLYILEECWLKY
jgi:hypothetical protein